VAALAICGAWVGGVAIEGGGEVTRAEESTSIAEGVAWEGGGLMSMAAVSLVFPGGDASGQSDLEALKSLEISDIPEKGGHLARGLGFYHDGWGQVGRGKATSVCAARQLAQESVHPVEEKGSKKG